MQANEVWYHAKNDDLAICEIARPDDIYRDAGYSMYLHYRPEMCINMNGWMKWYLRDDREANRQGWRKIGEL